MSEHRTERTDSEILASRTVKAGKRVYYIDVKRDRRGERYIALTESKRVRDGDETMRPVFEKHKIFLYREDFEKFMTAFGEMLDYARDGIDENATYTPTPWEGQTDVTDVRQTWWWQLIDEGGYILGTNDSWSGSTKQSIPAQSIAALFRQQTLLRRYQRIQYSDPRRY